MGVIRKRAPVQESSSVAPRITRRQPPTHGLNENRRSSTARYSYDGRLGRGAQSPVHAMRGVARLVAGASFHLRRGEIQQRASRSRHRRRQLLQARSGLLNRRLLWAYEVNRCCASTTPARYADRKKAAINMSTAYFSKTVVAFARGLRSQHRRHATGIAATKNARRMHRRLSHYTTSLVMPCSRLLMPPLLTTRRRICDK